MASQGSVLTFRVGERRLALEAGEVAEVVRRPLITRVPQAPPALSGVANVRGEVIPVVSVAGLLGEAAAAPAVDRLIVLDRAERLGLAVDEVMGLAHGHAARGGLVLQDGGETRVLSIDELLQKAFTAAAPRAARRRETAETRAEARPEAAEIALLAFLLAGQPYALPLEQVREVLAAPEGVRRLPRADAAMLGVIRHRGALLPVVSTRALLGLPVEPLAAKARIVVAAIGGSRVGLAVDEMSAVLHAPLSAIGPVPRVLNRGAGEAQIDAMLRTGDGGLVAVLAPERLFREESAAQILEDGRMTPDESPAEARREAGERFLVFRLGEETYGLPIASVQEVVNLPASLTRVPNAPRFVSGVMSLRGAAVPVIDQRRRFGVEAAAAARPRVMVVQIGDLLAGFAVDAISEIAEIGDGQLQGAPGLATEAGGPFDRVAKLADGRVVLLVNPQALLDRAEADLLASVAEAAAPAS
jgi:purine-binding chemotaxis protein CheW